MTHSGASIRMMRVQASFYPKDLDMFVPAQLLKDSPAVLSLRKTVSRQDIHSSEWKEDQSPVLINTGKTISCKSDTVSSDPKFAVGDRGQSSVSGDRVQTYESSGSQHNIPEWNANTQQSVTTSSTTTSSSEPLQQTTSRWSTHDTGVAH